MLAAPVQEAAPAEPFSEAAEEITLPNLKRVRIRQLRAGEERPVRELLTRLSRETWYFRFLSSMSRAPDSLVRLLACVDDRRKVALVVEHHAAQGSEVVALANFAAVDDDHDAELGLVVRDDWQRQRVGTELAIRLMLAAERRGFHQFVIHALPENTGIRLLLKNVGTIVSSRFSGGVFEIAFVRRTRDRCGGDPE